MVGPRARGVRAGVEQRVIDVIKFNRDVSGLSDKDATAIRFGRALLRDHKVAPSCGRRPSATSAARAPSKSPP